MPCSVIIKFVNAQNADTTEHTQQKTSWLSRHSPASTQTRRWRMRMMFGCHADNWNINIIYICVCTKTSVGLECTQAPIMWFTCRLFLGVLDAAPSCQHKHGVEMQSNDFPLVAFWDLRFECEYLIKLYFKNKCTIHVHILYIYYIFVQRDTQ